MIKIGRYMKQLIQNLRTGHLEVEEVPPPTLTAPGVLVRNVYSLISSGTERTTVSTGQSSLLGKARSRPDLVRQVLQNVKREGVALTYQKVMTRLNKPKALGYSSAGIVIKAIGDTDEFKPGDRVACGGGDYACHAELVFVPRNLCVPVPADVDFREAAFTTVGAIAMQGVRQAGVTIGDYVAVIGLGLVGILTVQILKSAGCQVIGFDINADVLALAEDFGADKTILITDPKAEEKVVDFTGGCGADDVIITAGTSSNQPVEIAGKIARDRGTIVMVGATKMDIPRSLFYEKELNVKLSRSYGPGRYDPTYEEKGVDYPVGYVRWTERRNMAGFLELVAAKKINLEKMITHVFPIEDAVKAYDIVMGKTNEKCLAILLEYKTASEPENEMLAPRVDLAKDGQIRRANGMNLGIGFVGAGHFAQNSLLPPLRDDNGAQLLGVATATGVNAKSIGKKFGFRFCTTDPAEILQNPDIHCVFIATRHNLHSRFAVEALQQQKHVFVEKPLALSEEELSAVIAAYQSSPCELMVGFNRRFSPLLRRVKEFFSPPQSPLVIQYRVNAGYIPKTHWAQDPIEGGGRILGEVCHFVDVMQYLTDAEPTRVYAEAVSCRNPTVVNSDNVNITVAFSDGSVGAITYVALGDSGLGKERIEVFGGNAVAIVDDFRVAEFYTNRKRVKKLRHRGKGHNEEVKEFIAALRAGSPSPIPFKSLLLTTMTTLSINESLRKQTPVTITSPLGPNVEAVRASSQI
jgi:predicted dehydrogenase/threonine dehydrogenase-like Zn-dependent dehydrogenase